MYHYKKMWTTKKSLMLIVLLFTVFINVGCSTSLNYKVDVDMNGFLQTTEPIGIYDVSFKEKYINGSNSASSYHFEAKLKKNTSSPYSGKAVVVIQYYDKKGNLVDEQSYETEYSMREGDTSIISENFWDKFQAKRLKINDTVIYSAKIISVTERDAAEDDKIVEQRQKELEKQVAELKEEEQKKKTEETESKAQLQTQTQQSSQSASNSSKSNQTQQQSSNSSTTDNANVSSNNSKNQSSTSALDKSHHGIGYSVSYPSSFMVRQEKESMFAVLEPTSGSNVTIMNLSMLGNFNDFIPDKENAESLFQTMAIGTIESEVQSGHLNGYKCYECKIKTFEGAMTTQYITGDNDSLYLICIGKGNGISSTNSKTLDEVLQSFKLEN